MIHSLRFISLFIFISCAAPLSDITPNEGQYPSDQSFEKLDKEIQTYKNDEPGWVEVEETRIFSNSIAPDKAEQEILKRLRAQAISMKIPETVDISSLLTNVAVESGEVSSEQTAWSNFIIGTVSGSITAEKILHNDMQSLSGKNSYQKTIRLKAYVEPVKGQRDPSFYIDVKIKNDNNLFKPGDELEFNIVSSQDCFIYVFNLMADQTVLMMYPNKYMKENFIKANTTLYIPDKSIRDHFSFEVNTLPGQTITSESVYIVCTKKQVRSILDVPIVGDDLYKKGINFTKIQKWLSNIPLNQRVERNMVYHVSN